MDPLPHRQKLYSLAMRILRNSADADDVVQDVFVRALSSSFEGRSSAYTWLYRVTYNACIDKLRANGRSMPDVRGSVPVPDELLEREQQVVCLDDVLGKLPQPMGSIMRMRLEGKDYKQIAEELGMPINTVKTYLFRARRRLSKELLATA